ncbi:MAG: DUF1302 family protein [Nitrospiria bacterium]
MDSRTSGTEQPAEVTDQKIAAIFEKGRHLMNAGALDEAVAAFQDVLLANPIHTPSYLLLGIIYTRKGRLDRSIEVLKQAVEIDPNLLAGYLLLGQAYAAVNAPEKAIATFERATAVAPEYPGGHYFLGLVHQGKGEVFKAAAFYRAALAAKGDAPEKKQAQNQLDGLKKQADFFFENGTARLKQGEVEAAADFFQKGLTLDPDNPKALFSSGIIAIQQERLEDAVEALKSALQQKPDLFPARLFLGQTYENQGKIGPAITEYRNILDNIPDLNQQEAVFARKKLAQIGETPEVGKLVQAFLKEGSRLLSKKDNKGAKAAFLVVLAFLPKQVLVHYHLGQIAFDRGDFAEAVDRLKTAIKIDENHYLSYFLLGEIYERLENLEAAIHIYKDAAKVRPMAAGVYIRLGILYEKTDDIQKALTAYHKVLDLLKDSAAPGRKLAQGRIDLYEKRFRVSYTDVAVTFDSNRTQSNRPESEITSESNLGLTYFLMKKERLKIPFQINFNTRLLHRAQLYFMNSGASLFYAQSIAAYNVLLGYNFRVGSMHGETTAAGKSVRINSYTGEISRQGTFPSSATLRVSYQDIAVYSNPIFGTRLLTGTGMLAQNVSFFGVDLGRVQLSYAYGNNEVRANDQERITQTLRGNYSRDMGSSLKLTLGASYTESDYLNADSFALSQGISQKRKNKLYSATAGLSYTLQPGVTFFANYTKNKNLSNLAVASDLDLVDINSGQVQSLGAYEQDVISFGMTGAADLEFLYPQWTEIGKQLTVGITMGYYRPSLKGLNRILGDSKTVIAQDPNHILPSNPRFLSETRNLEMGKIKGSTTTGIEAEWEISKRNGLVFSLSEWQNSTVRTDIIPLLLSPTQPPALVPRSARYNLTINQMFLSWRHSLYHNPTKGRIFVDLGLFGGSFVNFTADALIRVEENPAGGPFVSLGSFEARGRSFTTRAGLGGAIFIRPWLSFGLSVNYLWGTVTKLTVDREFPSGFRAVPAGLPGVSDNACFRLISNRAAGETLTTVTCDNDQIREGTRPETLKLKLDGVEGRAALRFHFGKGSPGRTPFEKWLDRDDGGAAPATTANLNFDGALKHETAYRINRPVTFTKALTLLRLNSQYRISPKYRIAARSRAFYDAIYDFVDVDTISPRRFENTILTQLPRNPTREEVAGVNVENSRGVEINQEGLELRELYLDARFKNVDLRIGKQIVRWGVVPGARVTDEINPFDFGEFILREMEDRFIPLVMVKADFFPADARFELIWITEVAPHKPAPAGSEFEQFQILPNFVAPESFLDHSLNLKTDAFENTEIAGRLVQNFGGWEVGFTAFYHWDDFPASFRTIEGAGDNPFSNLPEVDFAPRMNRITTVGTTLTTSFGRMVLNAEFAYVFGKLFGTLLDTEAAAAAEADPDSDQTSLLGELKRDFMKYAVGLDFAFLGADMSVQFIQQFIPGWDPAILQDRIDTVAAHFVRKTFMNEQLVTRMLTLYFINEADFLFRPALEARLTDNVKVIFGSDIFLGDRGEQVGQFDFIGFFKDSSRVYLEIGYSF